MVTAPPPEAVVAQLGRILQSTTFQGAERSTALLRFLVEQSVAGRGDSLKEYTLGSEALGRGDTFDPRTDPIVRAEASRLRVRLERYYATEGQADATLILLPKGSYVPRFQDRAQQPGNEPPAAEAAPSRPAARSWLAWLALGGAAGAAALTLAVLMRTPPPAEQPLMIFPDVDLKSDGVLASDVGTDVILSPDGGRVVYVSRGSDGVTRLHTRRLDQHAFSELPGTEGARVPFFSPDGQWVGFWASGTLKRTAIGGGTPVHLRDAVDLMGASWGEDGYIVATLAFGQLWRVSAASGEAELLADLTGESIDPRWPQILPGGQHVLFTAVTPGGPDTATIDVLSLVDGTRNTVARGGTYGRYLPPGYLTYVNQGSLFAVAFDLERLEADQRPPVPVLQDVLYSSTFGFAHLDVSRAGTVIYRRSTARRQLIAAWLDRAGLVEPWLSKPGEYTFPRLSPDGQRLAFVSAESGIRSAWIHERDSDRTTRLSASPVDYSPVWSPDGRVLVLGGGRGLHWLRAEGSGLPQPLTRTASVQIPWSFSPDGTRLAYHALSATTGFDLWTVQVQVTDEGVTAGEPEVFLRTPDFTTYPSFSPDGRWVAYASGAFGKWEVYVRPFPDNGSREVQVSAGGGRIARWLPNRRELLYRTDDHRLMVAAYRVENGSFIAEKPREWSPQRLAETGVLSNFDIAPDGMRVVALLPADATGEQSPSHVTFALNFAQEVHRRVQSRGR
jgi:Tol biopolymer transport system component